jgi:hypothetical protein
MHSKSVISFSVEEFTGATGLKVHYKGIITVDGFITQVFEGLPHIGSVANKVDMVRFMTYLVEKYKFFNDTQLTTWELRKIMDCPQFNSEAIVALLNEFNEYKFALTQSAGQ